MDGQRVRARELLLRETYTLNVRIWDADHMGKEGDLSNLLGKLNNYYHQGTNMKNLLLNLLTIVLLPVLAIYHALYWLFIVFPRPQQIGVKEYCKNRRNEVEDETYCKHCGTHYWDADSSCHFHKK